MKLGIIAGSGPLPARVAAAAAQSGRDVFIVAIEGEASPDIEAFAHARVGLGAIGQAIDHLKAHHCAQICIIGPVKRPDFRRLHLDGRGAVLMMKALVRGSGDDRILSAIVRELEGEGFKVIGADEILNDLLALPGRIAGPELSAQDWADIRQGADVVHQLGLLDVGQAAIVADGHVLAVEAAEGTDVMLARVAGLLQRYEMGTGAGNGRRGVLVKRPKPGQERRVDMPIIGPVTVRKAAAAGLSGIAVEAFGTLVFERDAVAEQANKENMFVVGFSAADLELASLPHDPKG